ncbi:hypothetical protein BCV71DRAFT_238364 [Rhizopus microsporus]|uniref:Uncharacterized protein n=1 Tax=Rhizopus microsporus TaxID=58291 RepID=A0A1X0RR89_RHIZD|nr:hypothetical protein BCV71DRAFT_238364 [Rhizopus microsporus]
MALSFSCFKKGSDNRNKLNIEVDDAIREMEKDIFSNKIDRYEATIKLLQLKRTNFKQGIPGCEVIRDDHAKIARGFDEMKSSTEANNNYLTARDLIRLGIFAKKLHLSQQYEEIFNVSINWHVHVFYLVMLLSDVIYVMYEAAKIEISMCILDLLLCDHSIINKCL